MTTTRTRPPAPVGAKSDDAVLDVALTRLAALPGAGRIELRAGQHLVHAGHLVPGVFLLLSGSVEISSRPGAGGGRLLSAAVRPVAVPDPRDLDARSPSDVVLTSDARALFVPRSVVPESEDARALFAQIAPRTPGRWTVEAEPEDDPE